MAVLNLDQVRKLVAENNRAKLFSDEFVICLIWKESSFDPEVKNAKSSATGLMQITRAAVTQVNRCTPKGVNFSHDDMKSPEVNIQCGTYYLDIAEQKLAGVDKSYGTGAGYSKNIRACEACMKAATQHGMGCLHTIHK